MPIERVQAARLLRAAPPAPVPKPAAVRTQIREVLQETFERAHLRARRDFTPAVRAGVELIHRHASQPAPSIATDQAEQFRRKYSRFQAQFPNRFASALRERTHCSE